MADQIQNYKNHARLWPPFHFVVVPILLANFIVAVVGAFRAPGLSSAWVAVVALALLMLSFVARVMALAVQDRVIRLEMRLRCREVLPADLCARTSALTRQQLVGLRFASDAELPALIRDVLDGKLTTQKEIKMRIQDWQGDHLRA
jgi:Family of unknown function (DUF6526)